MQDLLYVGLSFIFVFIILGLSTFFHANRWLDDEGSRKFVHIGVSHWIFFILLFEHILFALIAPVAFILLNYLSYQKNIFTVIERPKKRSLGTVYFSIALFLAVLFAFFMGDNKIFASALIAGILVLGYGDGFAAIIGKRFGKTSLLFGKSLEGSLTLFFVSILVLIVVTLAFEPHLFELTFWWIPLIAVIITFTEWLTPWGLDNITIPCFTTLLYYALILN